ncbi:MAG TPA: hypothetical protein VK824_11655 [Planctomycetota bacterium]|nr:hypothetical protein [Planctomycetota bacterium]
MKSSLLTSLTLALALAGPALAADLTPAERAALAAQPGTELLTMRAGESAPVPAVAPAERRALARAQAEARDLDALRAGNVSDHDLATIGLVVAVVVLLIVIF